MEFVVERGKIDKPFLDAKLCDAGISNGVLAPVAATGTIMFGNETVQPIRKSKINAQIQALVSFIFLSYCVYSFIPTSICVSS